MAQPTSGPAAAEQPAGGPAAAKQRVERHVLDNGAFIVFGTSAQQAEALRQRAASVCEFRRALIRPAGRPDDAGWRASSVHPESAFPLGQRLAAVLVEKLGRDDHRQELVVGVPRVGFKEEIGSGGTEKVVIDSAVVDTVSRQLHERDPQHDSLWANFEGKVQGPTSERLWGTGRFEVTRARLQELLQTTRVYTDPEALPPRFYRELVEVWSAREEYYRFFSCRRRVPLRLMGDPDEDRRLLECTRVRAADCEGRLAAAKETLRTKAGSVEELRTAAEEVAKADSWLRQLRVVTEHLEQDGESTRQIADRFHQWRQDVLRQWKDYGFASEQQCAASMDQSLTELSTMVCVSQQGYFLVEGTNDAHNQLCPATPAPVVFLSAAGIDFCSPDVTMLEAPKYFARPVPAEGKHVPAHIGWRGWLDDGAHRRISDRVRSLYTCIFEAARAQRVTHMSMLPLGLGVFLRNLENEDCQRVRDVYFAAQFDLLCEQDWGFEAYWLNPAQHGDAADKLLRERSPSCVVVLHRKDAKFLAREFANQGLISGFLNPSDCVGCMMSLFGNFWETGRLEGYVGEEDWAATSTGVLGVALGPALGRCVAERPPRAEQPAQARGSRPRPEAAAAPRPAGGPRPQGRPAAAAHPARGPRTPPAAQRRGETGATPPGGSGAAGTPQGDADSSPVFRVPLPANGLPLGLRLTEGQPVIAGIPPGTPAAIAGVPRGRVLRVGDEPVATEAALVRAVRRARQQGLPFVDLTVAPDRPSQSSPSRRAGSQPAAAASPGVPLNVPAKLQQLASPPCPAGSGGRAQGAGRAAKGTRRSASAALTALRREQDSARRGVRTHARLAPPFGSSCPRPLRLCPEADLAFSPSAADYVPARTRAGDRLGPDPRARPSSAPKRGAARFPPPDSQGPGPGAYQSPRGLAEAAEASPRRGCPGLARRSFSPPARVKEPPRAPPSSPVRRAQSPPRVDGRPRILPVERSGPGPAAYSVNKGLVHDAATTLKVAAPALRSGSPRMPRERQGNDSGDGSLCVDVKHRATPPPNAVAVRVSGLEGDSRWPAGSPPRAARGRAPPPGSPPRSPPRPPAPAARAGAPPPRGAKAADK